jgi:hypothetical protein
MAEVAMPRQLFPEILRLIVELQPFVDRIMGEVLADMRLRGRVRSMSDRMAEP